MWTSQRLMVTHYREMAMLRMMKPLNPPSISLLRLFRAGLAFLCLAPFYVLCGSSATSHPRIGPSLPQVTSQFAIADFDGDRRPDLATVQVGTGSSWNTQYWIAFQLSGGSRQILAVTAPTGGLEVTSRDVNGDTFVDVIVTTAWNNRPVAVLLNDGRGNFSTSNPSAYPGVFSTSEKFWLSLTQGIKDATAVLFSRLPASNCSDEEFLSPPNTTRAIVQWPSRKSLSSAVVSSLGRAPPTAVLHT